MQCILGGVSRTMAGPVVGVQAEAGGAQALEAHPQVPAAVGAAPAPRQALIHPCGARAWVRLPKIPP